MFIDRAPELAFLNTMLERQHPGSGQFVMMYGRRRVGKTALLRAWADAPRGIERIGFQPQAIGSHWSRKVQVDVVAVDWQSRQLLLGECKETGPSATRSSPAAARPRLHSRSLRLTLACLSISSSSMRTSAKSRDEGARPLGVRRLSQR